MVPDAFPALRPQQSGRDILDEQPAYDLIELFFFAYRDFVSRRPGLTIAELLDILRITKQSLNRVLKELIEKDFIESRMGTSDRRQRLLFATTKGHDLALKLAKLQTRRIMRALSGMEPEAKETISRYLLRLIDPSDSAHVKQLVFGPNET